MKVYQAIAAIAGELAKEGISKSRNNAAQGYKFRGIDDVLNALSGLLARHRLVILPRGVNRECVERVNQKGTALFYTTVSVEYDVVSAEDGSKHTVGPVYGEAMDSGDKSTNKAMSAAYKYMAIQTFAIPTEGDNDADATTHEVQAQPADESLLKAARVAADGGREVFKRFWQSISVHQRASLGVELDDLKGRVDGAEKKLAAAVAPKEEVSA